MEQNQKVILSIKRTADTIDGQIINYLQTEPFGLGKLPEIVMMTLKEYWLPFTICDAGAGSKELRRGAIWAIKRLEAQAALIRETFLESSADSGEPMLNDSQLWDESGDGLFTIEPSEDLKQINRLFGV
ncbi:hypothetical protein H6G80_30045 [Nostoc sp. FACHB-87]|uniref:hypothetical protein n=1 Tax=Nostocales TaxID=1161 RepID=UPI001684F08F|nr:MULTISPECIES: hypothetical protein [Nostocales]MBD2303283.1 hypothetical protein [Nostoc sp. FACHB-190]MBD2458296.1 hypothetical protein [Nostoc sp. FACHB-87]MBD2479444.1 hypothetical protein [Anabaena sp. FACHB-83]MBD2491262.1 hypothetical protein [Aulosira sp. FACHB-615]